MHRIEVNALPPSLNQFFGRMHWTRRKAFVDEWHILFLDAFRRAGLPKPMEYPITINATEYCKGNVRDADSCVVAVKLAGDALVKYGYLKDDSPKYVKTVILQCEKGKENKTVILIG